MVILRSNDQCIGLPVVTVTPSNQSVEVTLTAMFTATATGMGPLHYQWQRGNKTLTKETGRMYIIRNASEKDQNYYRCHVSNIHGDSVVSDRVWLQVTSMLFTYKMM